MSESPGQSPLQSDKENLVNRFIRGADFTEIARISDTHTRCKLVFVTTAIFSDTQEGVGIRDRSRPTELPRLPVTTVTTCSVAFIYPRHLLFGDSAGWEVYHLSYMPVQGDPQRSAHLIKVLAPIFFSGANTVVGGDFKCPFNQFWPSVQLKATYSESFADIVFLKHFDFPERTVVKEFADTMRHMASRREPSQVFSDIERLRSHYESLSLLDNTSKNIMPDTCCLFYNQTALGMRQRIKEFLMIWASDILYFSMREQLSVSAAMNRSNVRVQYIDLQ